eukprot:TRINITY_DN595_c0_g1_i2.p1 TRINITY_DN595_c0_g1~~TRINITY_DN595_c0_g1_i2.p1  ORF type:complete len:1488 (-),score=378.71 TRINITY_DN595_c0_g1_i2:32-4495(-)
MTVLAASSVHRTKTNLLEDAAWEGQKKTLARAKTNLLEDAAWERRKITLARLQAAVASHDIGARDEQDIISEALDEVDNKDPEIRMTALSLVLQVGSKGDRLCVQAGLSGLEDKDIRVREKASQVLYELSTAGDEEVIAAAVKSIKDWHRPVRDASLKLLQRLASEVGGNSFAAAAVAELLEDPVSGYRLIAAEIIGHVAIRGDLGTIELVAKRLENVRREVRAACMEALPQLADLGYPPLVEAVLKRLENEVDYVRVSAGQAVMHVASDKDYKAAEAVALRLEHEDRGVRTAASQVLARFRPEVARQVALQRLSHENEDVRCSALGALASIGRGDKECIREVGMALQDPSGKVRTMAIPLLRGLVANQGLQCSLVAAKAASQALESEHRHIREVGSLALAGIANANHEQPKPKKLEFKKQVDLETQLDDARRSELVQLRTRHGHREQEGDLFGKISQQELDIVNALIEQAEARAGTSPLRTPQQESGGEKKDLRPTAVDQLVGAEVLKQLHGMAEEGRMGEELFEEESSSDESEDEEQNLDQDLEGNTDEQEYVSKQERMKSRLQGLVKKAYVGDLSVKRKKSVARPRKSHQFRNAAKLAVNMAQAAEPKKKRKERPDYAEAWNNVEMLLQSGESSKRQQGIEELPAAAGMVGTGTAGAPLPEILRMRIGAKRLLTAGVKEEACWMVRVAALDAVRSVAKEENVDLLPLAIYATSDSRWQVRCAAAKACEAFIIEGSSNLGTERLDEILAALVKLSRDWHAEVAMEGIAVLGRIQLEVQDLEEGLHGHIACALQHLDSRVCAAAGDVLLRLAKLQKHEAAAAEAAASMLEHEEKDAKEEARSLLFRFGATGVSVTAAAQRLSESHEEQTRCAALQTLTDISQLADSKVEEMDELGWLPEHVEHFSQEATRAAICQGLQSSSAVVRSELISCLRKFTGNAAWMQAVQFVEEVLANSSAPPPVRRDALHAVTCLFATSDSVAYGGLSGPAVDTMGKDQLSNLLEKVASRLEDEDEEVRTTTGIALNRITQHGGRARAVPAISHAAKRLGHHAEEVRDSAQEALKRLGGHAQGKPKTPSTPEGSHRRRTAQSYGRRSVIGDIRLAHETAAISANSLGSALPGERYASGQVLLRLAEESQDGLYAAASLAAGHLQNEDKGVIDNAVRLLCQLRGAEGNRHVLEEMSQYLMSPSAMTREAALKVLVTLSPLGSTNDDPSDDSGVHHGLLLRMRVASLLEDKVPQVRSVAVPALVQLARADDWDTVSHVALQLPKSPSDVRKDILAALVQIWAKEGIHAKGPKEAVAVTSCLEDESATVRDHVSTLLRSSEAHGDESVLCSVAARLRNPLQEVREAAVEALCAAANPCAGLGYDRGAIAAAAVYLEAEDWNVKVSAVDAIVNLLPPSQDGVARSLREILNAQDDALWEAHSKARTAVLEQLCQPSKDMRNELVNEGRKLMRQFVTRSLMDHMEDENNVQSDIADFWKHLRDD